MATETVNYGTRTLFAKDGEALEGLTSGQAKAMGKIDNSTTKAVAWLIEINCTLASSGVADPKNIEIYLITAGDDTTTTYTDGIDPEPTTPGDVASSLKNARVVSTIKADTNSQVVKHRFVLDTGHPWKFLGLVAKNNTAATILNTGGTGTAYYTPIKYDNA